MSNIGVHPGLYSQIRAYAELVDRVLVGLRRGHADTDERQAQLGGLLMQIGDSGGVRAEGKLLEWMLREAGGPTASRLHEIGERLSAGTAGIDLIDDLEALARTLERERATAFAKMQGR